MKRYLILLFTIFMTSLCLAQERKSLKIYQGDNVYKYILSNVDSITHNDETLSTVLEAIKSTVSTNNTAVNNKIDSEISRAKAEETAIKESIENLKDSTSESIADLNLKDQEIQSSLSNEINRATEAENNLKTSVQDLKDSDSAIK